MATERILVVDDEQPVLDLLHDVLTGEGYVVDTALTGAEGLKLVRERLYDAVILDFSLPDMNGVSMHHQIRLMDEDLAKSTLFISGMTQSETQLDYYYTATAGFIEKPFDIQTILATVRDLLDRD